MPGKIEFSLCFLVTIWAVFQTFFVCGVFDIPSW